MEEDILERTQLRTVIAEHIHENIDHRKMAMAKDIQSKDERMDSIAHLLRQAVIDSPIVMFSGEPHVYVPYRGIYEPMTINDLGDALYRAMRMCRIKDGDYGRVESFTKLAMRAITNREATVCGHAVAMANGVYDTMDCKLHEFSKDYMINMKIPYPYDKDEDCPSWRRFLDEVLPLKEHQNLLQEFIASCFVDRSRIKIEQMLILLGAGANGKSVIFEIVSSLFGEGCVSHFSISDLIGKGRETNIAAINGKRLNYCSEIRTSEIDGKNSDALKAIVSGEPQMARKLYHAPFVASNIPLIMANANKLPLLGDQGDSIARRLLIIPFNVSIPYDKQDKELSDALKMELSGIFNWVMEGFSRLSDNSFSIFVPKDLKKVVENYVYESSTVASFCNDKGYARVANEATDTKPVWKHTGELYKEYVEWCKKTDEDPITRRSMSLEFNSLNFKHVRKVNGWGFELYKMVSDEEITELNMQIAKAMENARKKTELEYTYEDYSGITRVLGVSMLERYLGLPPATVAPYMIGGTLEGTYRKTESGPLFDVYAAQSALASGGYYSNIARQGGNITAKKTIGPLRGASRTFNTKMKSLGLPFRKYGRRRGSQMPVSEKDCILVPYDWEYSEENAKKIFNRIERDGEYKFDDRRYIDILT